MTDFAAWLNQELRDRGWSQRELARRSNMAHSTISDVLANVRGPSWDFCASVARAFGRDPDEIFVLAGLKESLPPPVKQEQDALRILRQLTPSARSAAMAMLRGLVGQSTNIPEEHERTRAETSTRARKLQHLVGQLDEIDPRLAEQIMDSTITQTEVTLTAILAVREQEHDSKSETGPPS